MDLSEADAVAPALRRQATRRRERLDGVPGLALEHAGDDADGVGVEAALYVD
jgi:hypothetical protein